MYIVEKPIFDFPFAHRPALNRQRPHRPVFTGKKMIEICTKKKNLAEARGMNRVAHSDSFAFPEPSDVALFITRIQPNHVRG
jgi:hypothetical protein